MTQVAARRLPGIRFEGAPRALDEALPRMDVAAFVGFAARGPIDVPVLVESPDEFAMVFGGELRLAWDRPNGCWSTAHLSGAVHAFFANGGTRCWVVRVADVFTAQANRFTLPGIGMTTAPTDDGGAWVLARATARARSEGSWSDGLRASLRLRRRAARIVHATETTTGHLELTVVVAPTATRGDLLRVLTADGLRAAFLPVREILPGGPGTLANTFIVHCDRRFALVQSDRMLSELSATGGEPQVGSADIDFLLLPGTRADIVTIDLRIGERGHSAIGDANASTQSRFDDIGLVPGHPRFWADLPNDTEWYGLSSEARAASTTPTDLRACPIAAERQKDSHDDSERVYFLPWGLTEQFGPAAGPATPVAPRLQRDGIDRFDPALFSDPEMREASRRLMPELADQLRYRVDAPRRLGGMHALLGSSADSVGEEASLFAVPDAVQRPWTRSTDADVQVRFEPVESVVPPASPPPPSFGACVAPLPQPKLAGDPATTAGPSSGTLKWTFDAAGGMPSFRIERLARTDATVADFSARIDESSDPTPGRAPNEYHLPEHEPGEYFYRVRIETRDDVGPWSQTLRVIVPDRHDYEIDHDADIAPGLRSIHRSMLTLGAARSDLFAVLSLPSAWRDVEACHHAQALREATPDTAFASSASSHGALYHPWIVSADGIARPPDGPIAGVIARRAIERGAWVAPANVTLRNAIALRPAIPPARWPDLQAARINVLRREPTGLTVLGADTLADEDELRPIQVRRLLATLRRLVLRLGTEFAFEANDESVRNAIEHRIEQALEALHRRSAFSGRRPADSFQVTARSTGDPSRDPDAGRLVVDVRVRPSQALRFITLRLAVSGAGSVLSEVI